MGIIAIMDGLQTFRIVLGADKRGGGGVRAVVAGRGAGVNLRAFLVLVRGFTSG